MVKQSSPMRSLRLVLFILAAVLIYAYGFQVTNVNLDEIQSEVRQTRLVRIIRALFQPDLFAGPVASFYEAYAGVRRIALDRGSWVDHAEGWVRGADLKPAESGALAGITAAEIRAAPEKFVGQTLDWRLQVIAVQLADELRPEMRPDQPYLLTRGPLPEPGFVYVTIPPSRIAEFRALPPLHEMVMLVTLR